MLIEKKKKEKFIIMFLIRMHFVTILKNYFIFNFREMRKNLKHDEILSDIVHLEIVDFTQFLILSESIIKR